MDWTCAACWSRPAQAAGAAVGWLVWMFPGLSGPRAAIVGLGVALGVMLPWAIRRAFARPEASLGNDLAGRLGSGR